jgi:ADP-ribosyl-[dinitrogen reductase] hydrolase
MITTLDRFRGCLLGLATGDALGHPIEMKRAGSFAPITGMIESPQFKMKGIWTDDTSRALCLAESLLTNHRWEQKHFLETLSKWYYDGHNSSVEQAFGSGRGTRQALERFNRTGHIYNDTPPLANGNGCIMGLAPLPMFYEANVTENWFSRSVKGVMNMAADQALTTHGDPEAIQVTKWLCAVIMGALKGISKEELVLSYYPKCEFYDFKTSPELEKVICGSYKSREIEEDLSQYHPTLRAIKERIKRPPIHAGRDALSCMEAAMWAFYHTNNFKDGVLKAVNLGEDTDTVGAVYGQIAGAYYGVKAIPKNWLKHLKEADKIDNIASLLYSSTR